MSAAVVVVVIFRRQGGAGRRRCRVDHAVILSIIHFHKRGCRVDEFAVRQHFASVFDAHNVAVSRTAYVGIAKPEILADPRCGDIDLTVA